MANLIEVHHVDGAGTWNPEVVMTSGSEVARRADEDQVKDEEGAFRLLPFL